MLFIFVIGKKKMTMPQDQGSPFTELAAGKPYEDILFLFFNLNDL